MSVTITYVEADDEKSFNTSNWLMRIPAKSLVKMGKANTNIMPNPMFNANTPEANEVLEKSDIIVVERNFFWQTLSMVQYWQDKGKLVVGVFDDGYHLMTPDNPAFNYWILNKHIEKDEKTGKEKVIIFRPKPMDLFKVGLEIFHGYHTPSKTLTKEFADYNSNNFYIPNFLDIESYIYVPKPENKSKEDINIFWGGSLSHWKSFLDSGCVNAIKRIFKNDKRLKLIIAGDQRVYDLFPLEWDRKIFFNFVPYSSWSKILSYADIGIAPLSGPYDQMRSWIKLMEFGILGIPSISSISKSYEGLEQYTHPTKNESKFWEDNFIKVIENLPKEKEYANDICKPFVLKQNIDLNVDRILKTYAELARKSGFDVIED
jgi:hypothetical protein